MAEGEERERMGREGLTEDNIVGPGGGGGGGAGLKAVVKPTLEAPRKGKGLVTS